MTSFYSILVFFLCSFSCYLPLYGEDVHNWMYLQIEEDLRPFSMSGISCSDLDRFMAEQPKNNPNLLVKFSIRNNVLSTTPASFQHDRVISVAKEIREILSTRSVPDIDFIATMHDSLDGAVLPVPVFGFAKQPDRAPYVVLMPDFEALSGNIHMLRQVEIGKAKYPWHKKSYQAFWRGAMTGGTFTPTTFLDFPRSKAVSLSLKYPTLINARYTVLTQCTECNVIKSKYEHYFGRSVSITDHLAYKYLLLIDGNSCAYSRAFWQLFSNCTVLKQESPSVQWFYRCLVPYVHYIPLRADLSDLPDVIAWAINHDKECYEISRQANDFAIGNLTRGCVQKYLHLLLMEYSKLYRK